MSEVWITNPNLTPEHDVKVLRAALGTYASCGWQVRDDQSDPAPELVDAELVETEPAETEQVETDDDPSTEIEPASDPEPVTTEEKGEV